MSHERYDDVDEDVAFAVDGLLEGDVDALHDLGNALRRAGDHAAAATVFHEAQRRGVTDSLLNLGIAKMDLGEDDAAAVWFERSAEAGDVKGAFMAAQLAADTGDLVRAESFYRRATALPETGVRLAKVLRALGEDDEARALVYETRFDSPESAVECVLGEMVPADDRVALLESFADTDPLPVSVTLANLYEERGDVARARATLEDATLLGDENAQTNLGILLLDLGEPDEARRLLTLSCDSGDELACRALAEPGWAGTRRTRLTGWLGRRRVSLRRSRTR